MLTLYRNSDYKPEIWERFSAKGSYFELLITKKIFGACRDYTRFDFAAYRRQRINTIDFSYSENLCF